MKRYFLMFLGLLILVAWPFEASQACTYVFLKAKDGSIVSVRSQEFFTKLGAQLQMIPRGTAYASPGPKGTKGLQWKSKYGVVAIPVLGNKNIMADAAKEKGL